ncbi:MAG: NrfD/PsrC family molybdoenzyme membrane anchor subunit [bacterium]
MKRKLDRPEEAPAAARGTGSMPWLAASAALVLVGAVAFVVVIRGSEPQRAWQAYLVNFLFWTGMAFGAVVFSAALRMTNACWAGQIQRLAEAPASFLPFAFVLFWILYAGREYLFPWIHEPVPEKAAWLNVPFLFARDGVGILAFTASSVALVHASVRRDRQAGAQQPAPLSGLARIERILPPLVAVLYGFVLTLLAFDLIMSLDPHWLSTLFGAYYFVGSLYTGLAVLMLMAALLSRRKGGEAYVQPKQLHDLGKLMLAFCLVTADFFFTQFLVIWYGNLSEETPFVILRVRQSPWSTLSLTVLIVCFALPFVVLLSRSAKKTPAAMIGLSLIILIGMWLERFLLVIPSLWAGETLPIGLAEALITAGFLGLMSFCLLLFFRRYPLVPIPGSWSGPGERGMNGRCHG